MSEKNASTAVMLPMKLSLRQKKQSLLITIYEGFLQNSSNDSTLRIVAKLVHFNCLQYNQKSLIIDQNLNNNERADKLFDYVYRSDINVIDVFLSEMKDIFPYLYRLIDSKNKEINSEHRLSYYVSSIDVKTDRDRKSQLVRELDNDKLDKILIDLSEIHILREDFQTLKEDKIKGIEEKLDEILNLLKSNKLCSIAPSTNDCSSTSDYGSIDSVSDVNSTRSQSNKIRENPIDVPEIEVNTQANINENNFISRRDTTTSFDMNQTFSKAAKNFKRLFRHKTFSCEKETNNPREIIGKYTRLSKKQKQDALNALNNQNINCRVGGSLEAINEQNDNEYLTHL